MSLYENFTAGEATVTNLTVTGTLSAASGVTVSTAAATITTLTSTTGNITTVAATTVGATTGNITTVNSSSVSNAVTITSATPSTTRAVLSEVTLTPSTTMSVSGGGSIAGSRGAVTVTTGKTFVDGFLYGAQGKATLNGTLAQASAGRIVGVLGQIDLASGTVTSGQVSGVWADIQMTSPTLTSHAEINAVRATNSGGSNINSMFYVHGKADFILDANEATPSFIATPGGATASGNLRTLKVQIAGATYYILAAATYS